MEGSLDLGQKQATTVVCSPIGNHCQSVSGTIVAKCMFFSVDNKFKQIYEIEFKVLSALDKQIYDVIIGLPDIRKHNLLCTFANQF